LSWTWACQPRPVRPTHLPDGLVGLEGDVGDVAADHERDEVEQERAALAEDGEGRAAERLEASVVRRLDAAHGVDHLLAELDGRHEWLGVAAEDVAKVDCAVSFARRPRRTVKEVAVGREQQVVEMTIADAEEVGEHAVAG